MEWVRDEELLEWAEKRADDAGRLARDLVALRNDMIEVLEDCESYFDNKADADFDQDGFNPNREMVLLLAVKSAIARATGT